MSSTACRLDRLCDRIDTVNALIGRTVKWLILVLVLTQFSIVVLRYIYGTTYAVMLETVMFSHAILLALGAGYTLLHEGHVRVDVFYSEASARTRAWINLLGVVLLLIPSCVFIFSFTINYVLRSWAILEAPLVTGGAGPIYLLKTLMPAFAILFLIQGLSLGLRSLATLMRHPNAEGVAPTGRAS